MRRRVASLVSLAVLAVLGAGCSTDQGSLPGCTRPDDSVFALIAQSVPTATQLPCLKELPVGWNLSDSLIRDGQTQLWLDSTIAGIHAVEIDLRATCDVSEAVQVPPAPDEVGMTTYVDADLPPAFSGARYLVFEGGCVTYRYHFTGDAPPTLALEAEEALSFIPRISVVREVRDEYDQTLCGADAPPCDG
jgi:hypothetical protein